MNPRRWLFVFLGLLTVLRLAYVGMVELSPDEAYYYLWSERLDWAYFSKGPGVAATIWLGTWLFGAGEFGVRFFSPLLALGTSGLIFVLARRLYGERVGVWSVLMINVVPIFTAGSLLMTIDPLSIFFWAAALVTCWLALEKSPALSWWWPLTGVLVGLGFLCKYTNAMELLSILLLLACTPSHRAELKRPGFYLMLLAFLPFTLPPLLWNAEHDWVTVGHLSQRGGLERAFALRPSEFGKFVGAHFGAYSPLLFGGMIAGVVWAFPLARERFRERFLLAFTLPLWGLYLWLSLKKAGEANWTAPAMVSLGILATALWHERAMVSRKAARFAGAALGLGLMMSVLVLNTDLVRSFGIPWAYRRDPSTRLRGWHGAAREMERIRAVQEEQTGQRLFLIAGSYGTASELAFYLEDKRVEGPSHPPVYFTESQHVENQFSFWPRYDEFQIAPQGEGRELRDELFKEEEGFNPFHGRSALYIADRIDRGVPSSISNGFEKVELVAQVEQERRGLRLRQWRVYLCTNYRGVEL